MASHPNKTPVPANGHSTLLTHNVEASTGTYEMTDEERVALKIACLQAAATLIAAVPNRDGAEHQVKECAARARMMFKEIAGVPWTESAVGLGSGQI